ncbi:MAG TPA: proton-conducting transporter membrane subunit, partial [Stellaceae bacterium]
MHLALPDFMAALPEIFLAAASLALLVLGAFQGDKAAREIAWLAVAALVVAFALVASPLYSHGPERQVALYGLFIVDGFGAFSKMLVLIGSALTLILAMRFNEREGIARPEYAVLVLLATTGMMMMIAANDLISLYVALELQSLALYVVAAFHRDDIRSTEAGLK